MSNFSEKDLALLSDRNQRIKTSKHFIWAIIFTTLLFLGGCGMLNMFTESYEDIRDEMLQHLYEKYGVEFIGDSLERGNHDFLIAYPKYGDMQEDHVRMQRHGSGENVRYVDTFFGVIIRDDLEGAVTEALADIGLPFQVDFAAQHFVFDNRFDGAKTFADFNEWIAEGNSFRLSLSVFLGVDSKDGVDKLADIAFEKIRELGYMLRVTLSFTPIETFEHLTRDGRVGSLGMYRFEMTSFTESIN